MDYRKAKKIMSMILIMVLMLQLIPWNVAFAEETGPVDSEEAPVEEILNPEELNTDNSEETDKTDEANPIDSEEPEEQESASEDVKRFLKLFFYKSDAQAESAYLMKDSDFSADVAIAPAQEESRKIEIGEDLEELLPHVWSEGGGKAMKEMFSEDAMKAMGLWSGSRRFQVWTYSLLQDEESIGQFLMFLFESDFEGTLEYAFFLNNLEIDRDDLAAFMKQYDLDGNEFVAVEGYEAEELENIASMLQGNLELVASGLIGSEDDVELMLDLKGPQKVVVDEMTGEEVEGEDAEPIDDTTPTTPDIPIEEGVEVLTESSDEFWLGDAELLESTKAVLLRGMARKPAPTLAGVPEQEPVTADGITISKHTMRWLSASTGSTERAGFDTLELVAADDDIVPNQQWQLDFALAGKGNVEAGDIEITIPAYIWYDRDGNEPGLLTLAIPEEPNTNNDFAWKRVGDCIVITNTHAVSAGSKYMLQGTFRMTYPDPNADRPFDTTYAHQMVDIDAVDPSLHEFNGVSNDFYAELNVVTPRTREVLSMTSNSIHATLNTKIEVASATKAAVGKKVFFETPADMPASMIPANPDDYIYVQWYVDGTAVGSQEFDMIFHDTLPSTGYKKPDDSARESIPVHGVILGASETADGDIMPLSSSEIEGVLYRGYTKASKAAYVWVAYPKTDFPEEGMTYILTNSQTVSVTGRDDQITTTCSAGGEVAFRMPITWKIDKIWDDDDNVRGRRPEDLYVWIENKSNNNVIVLRNYLDDACNWHMEWTDDGSVSNYEAYEHSYAVSRTTTAPIITGYTDWVEYDNGLKYQRMWWYSREKTEYDETTHTWTFINKYHEADIWGSANELDISKKAINHLDNSVMATSDKDLLNLRNDKETTPLRYHVYTSTFCLPYTIREGGNPSDVSAHGQRYVTLELTDHDEYLEAHHLDYDEYRIDSVDMYDSRISNWIPSGTENIGHLATAGRIPVHLYGQSNGGEWIEYAVLDEGVVTTMNGATCVGKNVRFPQDVHQVKATARTNAAHMFVEYNVNVVLYPSDRNKEVVETIFSLTDYGMARSFNYATTQLKNDNQDVLGEITRWDATYLHGRNYRLAEDLVKTTTFTENDREARALRIRNDLKLVQQSNITYRMDYLAAVEDGNVPSSNSGTFYDLLPLGMVADLSTISIENGTVKTADVIENYQNTGRQLVVVTVDIGDGYGYRDEHDTDAYTNDDTYPINGYKTETTLSFDMLYNYESAKNLGLTNIKNYAAYEADEDVFGNVQDWSGESDVPDGTNHKHSLSFIDSDVAPLMTNLDDDRDDPNFVYASDPIRITELDFAAMTDIRKQVQVVGSDRWSYGHENDVNVYEGGKYAYRIQLTSDTDTQTKDTIILDSLENYMLKPGDDDYSDSQWSWKGSFLSIDVSEIAAIGVDPVVYYCTDENIDIYNFNPAHDKTSVMNILSGPGWTTTLPADPSTVKAFAIDCRHAKDGSDFILEEGMTLLAYVYMKAPTWWTNPEAFDAVEYKDHLKNAHAYNNVFMDVTQIDEVGGETHAYSHFDYTKVGIMGFDIDVHKTWDDLNDNDRIRPGEVMAHLYANGADTGRSVVLSAEDWNGVFQHVLKYDDDGRTIRYELVEDPVPGYTFKSITNVRGDEIELRNTHDPEKVEIPYTKVWMSNEPLGWESAIPASIKIKLLVDGEYTGISQVLREGVDGSWTGSFKNLLKYDQGREIVYTVDEEEIPDFRKTISGNEITNFYYPYGDLSIEKQVTNGTSAALAQSFTFTLTLNDRDDEPLTERYSYVIVNALGNEVRSGRIGNGGEFTLMDGEKLILRNLPSGSKYKVTESPKPGFTIASSTNNQGTIIANSSVNSVFVNEYASFGQVSFQAKKTLTGRTLGKYQFKFAVYDEGGTQIRLATNALDGTVSFGNIRYNESDDGIEHTYTIEEINAAKPGYTYDPKVTTVKVTPHDNGNGTMTCEAHYFNAENVEISVPQYNNEYHAEGDITIRAWKVMPQRTLQNEEFEFELYDEEGNVLQTAKNQADGSVVFVPIHYTEQDVGKTYLYGIREVAGSDATVVYDDSEYGYKVIVLDNGDGTLSFTQTTIDAENMFIECPNCHGEPSEMPGGICGNCNSTGRIKNPDYDPQEGELPVFTNMLKDGSLSITKEVAADNPSRIDPDQEFEFEVRFIGEGFEEDTTWHYTLEQVPTP